MADPPTVSKHKNPKVGQQHDRDDAPESAPALLAEILEPFNKVYRDYQQARFAGSQSATTTAAGNAGELLLSTCNSIIQAITGQCGDDFSDDINTAVKQVGEGYIRMKTNNANNNNPLDSIKRSLEEENYDTSDLLGAFDALRKRAQQADDPDHFHQVDLEAQFKQVREREASLLAQTRRDAKTISELEQTVNEHDHDPCEDCLNNMANSLKQTNERVDNLWGIGNTLATLREVTEAAGWSGPIVSVVTALVKGSETPGAKVLMETHTICSSAEVMSGILYCCIPSSCCCL